MKWRFGDNCITDWVALPASVVDTHLRFAGKLQLKVLLWLTRHGADGDLASCAAALSADPEECEDALHYWVECGVLVPLDAPHTAPSPAVTSETATPVTPVRARPAAVKPQLHEVIARQKENAEFAGLLDTVSARLGKPLSGGDMETLLYLFDTVGMPAEVIVMIVNWAVNHEKANLRYIEKMALGWADDDITTIAAAEERLCTMERRQKALDTLTNILELAILRPGGVQLDAADRWLNEWHFTPALLREAYTRTMDKTGKFTVKYMDRILEGWHEEGITDPAQLKGAPAATVATSLDTGGYEQLLIHYVPPLPDDAQ